MTTETKPNKARLLQWARALESGDYKQGGGGLKTDAGEYCCLGVACNIAKDAVGGRWTPHSNSPHYLFTLPDGSTEAAAYMPPQVAEWLGLEFGNPELDGSTATARNDVGNDSFADIGAAIRRQFDLPTVEQDAHMLAWIRALESGEYAQGSGHLKRGDAFCCLGVACNLAAADGVGRWGSATWGEEPFVTSEDAPRTGVLPDPVSVWLGVDTCDPQLDGVPATLRNDDKKQSFAEIAAAARIEFGFPTLEDEINSNRLRWIEALESGEYEQTSGTLRSTKGKFCCLGVACDLAAKSGLGAWDDDNPAVFQVGDHKNGGVMPTPVARQWLGAANPGSGDLQLDGIYATTRNDNEGNSFAEIAAAARIEWGFPPKGETA